MATSNGVFFQVTSPPPREAAGFEVRVVDHRDCSTELAVVKEYTQLTIGPELNTPGSESSPGAGSITLDRDSSFFDTSLTNGAAAETVLDYDYLWQAYEDGELRFEWFGTTVQENIVEDDGTRTVTISGPGSADVLKRACVMPTGEPQPAELLEPAYVNRFWKQFPVTYSAMHIWLDMLRTSQARGTIPWVTPLFTAEADPAGNPWPPVYTTPTNVEEGGVTPDKGMNLLKLLNKYTGQTTGSWFTQPLEWVMWPGFKLDVRRHIGSDRSGSVVFYEGQIEQLERTRNRESVANYILTVDVYGRTSPAVDTNSIARWGQREQVHNEVENITDDGRRDAISRVFLEQNNDETAEWVIKVPYDLPNRRPFVDYQLGDWVGISRLNSDQVSVIEKYRVMAIVLNVVDDTVTVELTLQSKLQLEQIRLQQAVTSIINKVTNNVTNNTGGPGTNIGNNSPIATKEPVIPTYDPSNDTWSKIPLNGGRLGGVKVFIQENDPGSEAQTGDFWVDSTYLEEPDPPIISQPDPPAPQVEQIPTGYLNVPGSRMKMI